MNSVAQTTALERVRRACEKREASLQADRAHHARGNKPWTEDFVANERRLATVPNLSLADLTDLLTKAESVAELEEALRGLSEAYSTFPNAVTTPGSWYSHARSLLNTKEEGI